MTTADDARLGRDDLGDDDLGDDHLGDDEARDDLGYEEARDELAQVVQRLEAGSLTLEESLALWERGEELARLCQERLDGARARLEAATDDGQVGEDDSGDETADDGQG